MDIDSTLMSEINYNYQIGKEAPLSNNGTYFNIYRKEFPNHKLGRAIDYVFFVKPDMNLITASGTGSESRAYVEGSTGAIIETLTDFFKSDKYGTALPGSATYPPFANYYKNEKGILLMSALGDGVTKTPFIPWLTNYVESFSQNDISFTPRESASTFTGWKMEYGHHTISSQASNSLSVTYSDDRDFSIFNLHKIWVMYINAVTRGDIAPKRKYIIQKMIDYASTMFFFKTAEDGQTLLYWAQYTGLYPTNSPSSSLDYSLSTPSTITYNINYEYFRFDDMSPFTIEHFNSLTPDTDELTVVPVESSQSSLTTWAKYPKITSKYDDFGNLTYKLRFYRDSSTQG